MIDGEEDPLRRARRRLFSSLTGVLLERMKDEAAEELREQQETICRASTVLDMWPFSAKPSLSEGGRYTCIKKMFVCVVCLFLR